MEICEICQKQFKSEYGLRSHMWKAHTVEGQNHKPGLGKKMSDEHRALLSNLNITRIWSIETRAKLSAAGRKRKQTSETKQKLSELMKVRHENGTAHNIGACRQNNEPSWPEKWFMQVIENEFKDKNYIREYPFFRFSLDFVWLDKRKVIEIDGEQHERFEEQKRRDIQKDQLLLENNFMLMRIKWKDMHNNTKLWIEAARKFIDE